MVSFSSLLLVATTLLSPIATTAQHAANVRRGGSTSTASASQAHRLAQVAAATTSLGRVTKLRLINADTNQPIAAYDPLPAKTLVDAASLPTTNLNIEAVTEGSVASMLWMFNGERRTEDAPLWAYCGNNGADFYACQRLRAGMNATISATPYSAKGANGTAGQGVSIELAIVTSTTPPPTVLTFTLMNADTDTEMGPLGNDTIIDLSKTPRVNVRANVVPSTLVKSVQFALNGNTVRVENGAPYALASNNGADYFAWTPPVGRHVIAGTAFGAQNAQGTFLSTASVSIVVHSGAPPVAAPTSVPVSPPASSTAAPVVPAPTLAPQTGAPTTKRPTSSAPTPGPTLAPKTSMPSPAPQRLPTRTPSRAPVPNPTRAPVTSAPIVPVTAPRTAPVTPAPAPKVQPWVPPPVPTLLLPPDSVKPQLLNVTLFDPVVDVSNTSATVAVEVTARDDLTGVRNVMIIVEGPTKQFRDSDTYTSLTRTGNRTVTLNLTLDFPTNIRPGDYPLNIIVYDEWNNQNNYDYLWLRRLGLPDSIRVINANADVEAPKLPQFNTPTPIVNVTNGPATAFFLVGLEDVMSGVKAAGLVATNAKGNRIETGRELNPPVIGNHTFNLTHKYPQYIKSERYWLQLTVVDALGNSKSYSTTELAALGYPSFVDVVNLKADVTPPQLTIFKRAGSAIVNASANAFATFDVQATDWQAGVYYLYVYATHVSTNTTIVRAPRPIPFAVRPIFDFRAVYQFGATSLRGVYTLSVDLIDDLNNAVTIRSEDLIARGLPGNFTVV